MNAGLDIINTLCKFYGVCAPIFIDNRESVNDIIETESQIINLVVNKDNFFNNQINNATMEKKIEKGEIYFTGGNIRTYDVRNDK